MGHERPLHCTAQSDGAVLAPNVRPSPTACVRHTHYERTAKARARTHANVRTRARALATIRTRARKRRRSRSSHRRSLRRDPAQRRERPFASGGTGRGRQVRRRPTRDLARQRGPVDRPRSAVVCVLLRPARSSCVGCAVCACGVRACSGEHGGTRQSTHSQASRCAPSPHASHPPHKFAPDSSREEASCHAAPCASFPVIPHRRQPGRSATYRSRSIIFIASSEIVTTCDRLRSAGRGAMTWRVRTTCRCVGYGSRWSAAHGGRSWGLSTSMLARRWDRMGSRRSIQMRPTGKNAADDCARRNEREDDLQRYPRQLLTLRLLTRQDVSAVGRIRAFERLHYRRPWASERVRGEACRELHL